MRTVFAHFGSLGDLITCAPALKALRTNGTVDVWMKPEMAHFCVVCGLADGKSKMISVKDRIPTFADAYDLGVTLNVSGVLGLPAAKTMVIALNGHDPVPQQRLKPLGLTGDPLPSFKAPPTTDYVGYVAVHPTGKIGKAIPEPQWLALCSELVKTEKLLLIGGMADFAISVRLGNKLPADRVAVCQDFLHLTASRIQNCKSFIGGETGMTHLAAALGVRSVATWETGHESWLPPLVTPVWHAARECHQITASQILSVWQP